MINLRDILKKEKGRTLLAVFPHPDDESFATGGLLQAAKECGLKTSLLCLTRGGRGLNNLGNGDLKKIRQQELEKAVSILAIDETKQLDFPDGDLRKTKRLWSFEVKKEIENINPKFVFTFDFSGITGHPDHICVCSEVFNIIKRKKDKPVLFLRVPGKHEKKLFYENDALKYSNSPDFFLKYGILEGLVKLKSIMSHKSQMQDLSFKKMVFDLSLGERSEVFYKADFGKNYGYEFVDYKID